MTSDEVLSLRQCISILGAYDIVVVCPHDINVAEYKELSTAINFCRINPWWLSSSRHFNRLKISPLLYWKFRRYDYILFYELDAYVFKDELDRWCRAGYDYIGAPWFCGFGECSNDSAFLGVGNGGFSLRRTSAALRVLRSFSYIRRPPQSPWLDELYPYEAAAFQGIDHIDRTLGRHPLVQKRLLGNLMPAAIRNTVLGNNTFYLLNDYIGHEDIFWGLIAPRNFSWFKVAPVDAARKFSFEYNPRRLFELNQNQLPFGCHAWNRIDPDFWEIYIAGFEVGRVRLARVFAEFQSRRAAIPGFALPSIVGRAEGEARVAVAGETPKGFLTYGPYACLAPGHYDVVISYSASSGGSSWDVTVNDGEDPAHVLQSGELTNTGGEQRELHVPLSFPDFAEQLQARTFYAGSGTVAVKAVGIKPLDTP